MRYITLTEKAQVRRGDMRIESMHIGAEDTMSNLQRDKHWRRLLNDLMEQQGVDLEYVAKYIGAPYNGKETVFYAKVPKKRLRFIGIGMALKQPVEIINEWIRTYSNEHALYVKDVAGDLIWIYLIGLNSTKPRNDVNYFMLFDECREAVLVTYQQLWDGFTLGSLDTPALEIELERTSYDDTFTGLKQFIVHHMDSFKTAYSRPRKMLDRYLECILNPAGTEDAVPATLNSLRGNLDDSMINYLSGDSETIHTLSRRKPVQMVRFKSIPKRRKTHISLCLALGMTREDIDKYLTLMSFSPLKEYGEEGKLIEMLAGWEKRHPLQRAYKKLCFEEHTGIRMTPEQRRNSVHEMLRMRRDLQLEYTEQGQVFPYG